MSGTATAGHRRTRLLSGLAAALLLALSAATARAAEPDRPPAPPALQLPSESEFRHLGVRECAGAPCHGAQQPQAGRVAQDEHTRWFREDRHARAYQTLRSERSRKIARNLSLEKPPHEAAQCLGCHADDPRARGPELRNEDGVGCEACHGGSQRWLKTHTGQQRTHAQNVADGLYPLDDPVRQAELCLSCHFGSARTPMRHRMLGAGHPRLRFELDSYRATQPPHYQLDADYAERGKQRIDPLKFWAIGQAVAARELLAVTADPARNRDGIWPEFAVLDCYTCHHAFEEQRRPVARGRGLQTSPGAPRLNDSALLMLRHILAAVDPELGQQLAVELRVLHAAIARSSGPPQAPARRLLELVETSLQRLRAWEVSGPGATRIVLSLIDEGIESAYCDYPSAEQASAAVQSLAAELHRLTPFSPGALRELNRGLERIFALVRDGERFPSELARFAAELRRIRALLLRE